ncbi:sodium-independent sulfate anion transporter-like [Lycorma delicatula]|uniref:sodium-independent sulfate anion transporter-like n=1 Tax=Lycorma delicatula TaxID=130591 RepID=UPI003F50E01D
MESRVGVLISKRIPIIKRLQSYTKVDFVSDFIAGVTVGLTMIPQSIAYANLAGLTPQFGLNSTFVGCIVYAIFGTIKEVSIGPTSLLSLLTFEYTRELTPAFVLFLTFISGIVEFLMGLLKLGFLVNFISAPVTSGFTTATSIIIIVSQLKGLLGVRFKSCGFLDNIFELIIHASETKLAGDFALGIFCVIFLLFLKKLNDLNFNTTTPGKQKLKKVLWFISTGRNAITVIISCCIAKWFEDNHKKTPFRLSGSGTSGIPPFQLPPFTAKIGNNTFNALEMTEELGSAVFIVPIIAVLANIAIAKAFTTGETIDATQEMLTLSLCNIFGSCLGSMPTCGAFTRSAVSSASGVRSPIAGVFSGCLSLLAINFLSSYFHLIPRATLSAVLISAVAYLIDWQIILPLWKTNKKDLFLLILTLVTCLGFGVEIGLFIGVTVNLAHLLYLWAHPSIKEEHCKCAGGEYVMLTPDKGLFFPAVDKLHTTILNVTKEKIKLPVIIDCIHFTGIDYTAAKALVTLVKQFKNDKQKLFFLNIKQEFITICTGIGYKEIPYFLNKDELESELFGDSMKKIINEKSVNIAVSNNKETNKISKEWSKGHEIIPLLNQREKNQNNLNI